MNFLAHIITGINIATNAMGKFLLTPIGVLPGWLSNTIVSAVAGVVLLIIFKYTSNQSAIGRVRDGIKANMLALKLYKDSIAVTLQSQGRVLKGSCLFLFHAIVPILVMIVPVSLLLAQLALWYQFRPLLPTEKALVTMQFNDKIISPWPTLSIEATDAVEVAAGPVRVLSKGQVYWEIEACENGYHRIVFNVGDKQFEKELVIGGGFTRLSTKRPGWRWSDVFLHPKEKPFGSDSLVQSVSIDYPRRFPKIFGIDRWIIYFFVASMVFAFLFKPFLKVKL